MEYRNIDISTWTQAGEGGNGKTYVHPGHPDILLKVNNPPRCDEATVKQELDFAQHVYALGIPTPRMFDMGHLFLVCQVYSQFPTAQDIFHMSQEQLKNFWNLFAEAYTGNKDISAFTALAGKFAPLDVCIRSILMPTPDAYKKLFAGVVHSLVEKFY